MDPEDLATLKSFGLSLSLPLALSDDSTQDLEDQGQYQSDMEPKLSEAQEETRHDTLTAAPASFLAAATAGKVRIAHLSCTHMHVKIGLLRNICGICMLPCIVEKASRTTDCLPHKDQGGELAGLERKVSQHQELLQNLVRALRKVGVLEGEPKEGLRSGTNELRLLADTPQSRDSTPAASCRRMAAGGCRLEAAPGRHACLPISAPCLTMLCSSLQRNTDSK